MTLVIMAAGMGSRYGGLKQIDPIGPNGEFIIDYSIYDAIKAGFDKIVFIIKRENFDIFKETIGKRIEKQIKVEYVFQDIPEFIEGRVKPLGTAHAIYCCRDVVNTNFAVINADDFYGYDGIKTIFDNLKKLDKNEYCMVGYEAINTLTENGSVKRGVCDIDNGYLTKITECSLEKENNSILATPLSGDKSFNISFDTLVSMNLLGFQPSIFKYMDEDFKCFLEKNKDDLSTCEWFIPDVIFKLIKNGEIKEKVVSTNAKWYGVTYKEDKQMVVDAIKKMIDDGIYPNKLWK